jgi:hypothetical protein
LEPSGIPNLDIANVSFRGHHFSAANTCYNFLNGGLIELRSLQDVQDVGQVLEQSCFVGDLPVANNIRYALLIIQRFDKILTSKAIHIKVESAHVGGV